MQGAAATKRNVGVVGARGYVGKELLDLLAQHPTAAVRMAISQRDGKSAEEVAAEGLDAYFLALPNGASGPYIEAIERVRPDAVIVDLSADHRFVDAWVYGQPERLRDRVRSSKRIANPGCYATAMQLALAPLVPILEGPAHVFGVSGYSGAGTTPSPRNDPEKLRDNLLPYALAGHVHEREVARQLGRRLFFMPHVAAFFRGITVTVSVAFAAPRDKGELEARYRESYAREPLVRLTAEAPVVRDIAGRHDVCIGGLTVSDDGLHAVVLATIDNLLGGAATQALRNFNLAVGDDELAGVPRAAAS